MSSFIENERLIAGRGMILQNVRTNCFHVKNPAIERKKIDQCKHLLSAAKIYHDALIISFVSF